MPDSRERLMLGALFIKIAATATVAVIVGGAAALIDVFWNFCGAPIPLARLLARIFGV